MSTIDCDICHREAQDNHSLNCTTCARSTLYGYRIELAKSLLGKEAVARQIEAITSGDLTTVQSTTTLDGAIVDLRDCVQSNRTAAVESETRAINENIHRISNKAVELRTSIEEMKKVIAERETRIKGFKSDAESAKYGLESRSVKSIDQVKRTIKDVEQRWDEKYDGVMQARLVLSRKMARLAGLNKSKLYDSKSKKLRDVYEIGKMQIFDLRDLNGADPEVLTASLTQISYLIVRISTYLSIRLPAEMQLPNEEHPMGAAIYQPISSYMPRQRNSSLGDVMSPTASHLLEPNHPGRRLLCITKSLPQLHKENSSSFLFFVEAVSLLGWNIAWLCRSQGMGSLPHWTDVTDIGRNLYQLLNSDTRGVPKTSADRSKQRSSISKSEESSTRDPTHFGRFSHGSAKHFIVSKEGNELMRGWKLGTPAQVVDKVKAHLVAEMQGAEWEMLDAGEWRDHEAGNLTSAGYVRVRTRTESFNTTKQSGSGSGSQRLTK